MVREVSTKKNWKYILKPSVTQKIEATLWGSVYLIIGFLLSISKYDLKPLHLNKIGIFKNGNTIKDVFICLKKKYGKFFF